eukprot:GHVP01027563.1.p1 GENE.GHVP01027563.1~~GHVP01027563.1.p1  ORF type:complete len:320 (+),score=74.09 GHVP01027563.1:475-1434(+)
MTDYFQCASQRMTFVWSIHEFFTIRELAKKKALPSKSPENIIIPSPKYQHGKNRWWLEIFPHFECEDKDFRSGVLLNLCNDKALEKQGILGSVFFAETEDGEEIPSSRQKIKFNEFRKGVSGEIFYFRIGFLHKDVFSSFVDCKGRLFLRFVVEFVNGENSTSSRVPKLEPKSYTTDAKLHRQKILWQIQNFSKERKLAQEGVRPSISPIYFFLEGMDESKEVLWWLRLNDKKGNISINLNSNLKEGFFRFEVFAETSDGLEIAKSGGGGFQNIKEHGKFVFKNFLKADQVNDCLGSDDTLNIRCIIEKWQILTIKEEE